MLKFECLSVDTFSLEHTYSDYSKPLHTSEHAKSSQRYVSPTMIMYLKFIVKSAHVISNRLKTLLLTLHKVLSDNPILAIPQYPPSLA